MTPSDTTHRATIDELRHTIHHLQTRANATRVVAAVVIVVVGLAASRDFHVFLVSGACLMVLVGVFAVGIPTQVRLLRARRQLTALLR
ncbi:MULTISPECIES: hypothetical protein [Actinomyces]|uniref:hypothetical protein n=1 Tax=Actinomyces TaxID=1654 RepID=UPI00135CF376|nr:MULTISPECIES: hypothetical protein [Actinomyces]